jgi:hypothetical protein
MATIDELRASGTRLVGFYGHPPRQVLQQWVERTGAEPVDLDLSLGAPASGLVPDAFCRIVENIVANGLALAEQLEVVVAATGAEKCDSGRFAAWLLRRAGVANVVETQNPGGPPVEPLLSQARGPLRERVDRIMRTVVEPLGEAERDRWMARRCQPTHGFWGTPPSVETVLDLLPETTHIYGWTRCVEADVPADLDLECFVDAEVPTVFFVQGFCDKALLARRLAADHGGLLVDVHDRLTGSVAAKIEAFVKLAAR